MQITSSTQARYTYTTNSNNSSKTANNAFDTQMQNSENTTESTDKSKQHSTSANNDVNIDKNKEYQDVQQKLLANIKSVLTTGFTIEELELIQKLLDKLKKLLEDKHQNKANIDTSINDTVNEIQSELAKILKKSTGQAIIKKVDKDHSKIDADTLEAFIKDIEQTLNDMRSGKYKKDAKNNESKV